MTFCHLSNRFSFFALCSPPIFLASLYGGHSSHSLFLFFHLENSKLFPFFFPWLGLSEVFPFFLVIPQPSFGIARCAKPVRARDSPAAFEVVCFFFCFFFSWFWRTWLAKPLLSFSLLSLRSFRPWPVGRPKQPRNLPRHVSPFLLCAAVPERPGVLNPLFSLFSPVLPSIYLKRWNFLNGSISPTLTPSPFLWRTPMFSPLFIHYFFFCAFFDPQSRSAVWTFPRLPNRRSRSTILIPPLFSFFFFCRYLGRVASRSSLYPVNPTLDRISLPSPFLRVD